MHRKKFLNGVTLIELLVVIAIIGILSLVSLAALASVKSSRQVKVVAEEIKDKIMDARSYAIAPADTGANGSVKYVRVSLTPKNGSEKANIKIQEIDGSGNVVGIDTKKEFPDNIDFDLVSGNIPRTPDPGSPATFNYSASKPGFIGQLVNSADEPVNEYNFIVQNTTGTEKYKLIVNRFGQISINKVSEGNIVEKTEANDGIIQSTIYTNIFLADLINECIAEERMLTASLNGARSGPITDGYQMCNGSLNKWPSLPEGYTAILGNGDLFDKWFVAVPLSGNQTWLCDGTAGCREFNEAVDTNYTCDANGCTRRAE